LGTLFTSEVRHLEKTVTGTSDRYVVDAERNASFPEATQRF
jgi:hypothetical protein